MKQKRIINRCDLQLDRALDCRSRGQGVDPLERATYIQIFVDFYPQIWLTLSEKISV